MTNEISEERRLILDKLYRSFEIISEGAYVYLCDMKYDYSKWTEEAVQYFGLPGEYMYHAGDIWEEHIHPDDQKGYHESIQAIFDGTDSGHDMQYRARDREGRTEGREESVEREEERRAKGEEEERGKEGTRGKEGDRRRSR